MLAKWKILNLSIHDLFHEKKHSLGNIWNQTTYQKIATVTFSMSWVTGAKPSKLWAGRGYFFLSKIVTSTYSKIGWPTNFRGKKLVTETRKDESFYFLISILGFSIF